MYRWNQIWSPSSTCSPYAIRTYLPSHPCIPIRMYCLRSFGYIAIISFRAVFISLISMQAGNGLNQVGLWEYKEARIFDTFSPLHRTSTVHGPRSSTVSGNPVRIIHVHNIRDFRTGPVYHITTISRYNTVVSRVCACTYSSWSNIIITLTSVVHIWDRGRSLRDGW